MFYKAIKDGRVVDVFDHLTYVKYQWKHNSMLLCPLFEAQGIASSDGNSYWHVKGLYHLPIDTYATVELVEIDEYEYRQLKALNMKTPEEIIDEYTLLLIDGGVL